MGLGAGGTGVAGGEPAGTDQLGLHQWVLPREGEALGHNPAEAVCDECPGPSSVGAPALPKEGTGKGAVFG